MTTCPDHRSSTRLTARWPLICVASTAALAALAPGIAVAHSASFTTEHSLSLTSGRLAGQLTSAPTECLNGRVITLYRTDPAGAVTVAARSNTLTFAADADGDGYSQTGGDCADDDAARHPGAYLAVDPTLSDPVRIAALTYPVDWYVACFGF